MYGLLIFLLFLTLIFYFFKGIFLILKQFLPYILIYFLLKYIFNQIFSSKNKLKSNSVDKSEEKDSNVIDVDYEEVE
tara:strand:- start:271 stop:501 length:231 start_codon:yes stop_codon:yes gene_type:complete